jgi:ribosomal protein S27AE
MKPNTRWRKNNPDKVRAHWIVANAIRYGKLKRQPCEKCGNPKSHAHHKDYSKPLEIEWLCHDCHWKAHGWVAKEIVKPVILTKKDKLLPTVLELKQQGKSYSQISLVVGVPKGTISKWINNPAYD